MKKIQSLFVILLLILLSGLLWADVPLRSEEFIYSIMAFNGRDYSGTFAKEDADTIYLMADVDNFLSVRKIMTYYWPITSEWRADPDSLNISFDGTLELEQKGKETEIIKPTRYTYYNISGKYEYNWVVKKGEDADRTWNSFQKAVNDYYALVTDYQKAKTLHEYMTENLASEIMKLRDEGEDMTLQIEKLKAAVPPEKPVFPIKYNTPPEPVREAFIINIPVGEYSIRFINNDGTVMESSEHNLIVFDKRRAQGIGYEIIPGDKWTRSVESTKSSSVLYFDGSTDLFLRSFFQQEYNDLFFEKMIRNDSKGNPNLMKWVRIQQVPNAKLRVDKSGSEPFYITEKPFVVEQIKGAALGYNIKPYDPEGDHAGTKPSLIALRLPREEGLDSFIIQALDEDGNALVGSVRQIRIINSENSNVALIFMSVIPLIVMLIIGIKRKRRYIS